MSFKSIPHPNGKSVRVVRIPESPSENPMTSDEDLIIALFDQIENMKPYMYHQFGCKFEPMESHCTCGLDKFVECK